MGQYDVKKFGALGNGKTVDTIAIQAAIDRCHYAGGGQVLLRRGDYLSGTLYLKSNVSLYIDRSARLLASPFIADYGDDTHYNRYVNETDMDRCFIYAEDAENISIEGGGEINGQAECFPNQGSRYRPMMIRLLRCSHVVLKCLRLYQAAAWTTAFLDSRDIWIDGLDIHNDKRYNGDGLDFDGCQNVFVSHCKIVGTDDNFCLQASSKEYPMKNVHVSDCHFSSICAAVRIGLKSIGNISNVTINGCTFESVWREGIKIECTEGGSITDITIRGNTMHNVTRPIFILLNNRLQPIGSSLGLAKMPEIGTLERIIISDLIAVDDEEMKNIHYRFKNDVMGCPEFNGIRVDAHKDHPIKNLILENIIYTFIGGAKKKDIPETYPRVYDLLREQPTERTSENYYPDWSRVSFMDIRHVCNLILSNILLHSLETDERESWIVEGCRCLKQDVEVI